MAAILSRGRWVNFGVTSDPAELPILPGHNLLCTNASEYNPKF